MTSPAFPGRDAIAADQTAKLTALLEALPSNAFYRRKLQAAGVGASGAIRSLEEFRQQVPPTEKWELTEDQRQHPPFGSNLTYPLERYTRFSQTSGTAGTPLRWLDTPESWEWMLGNWIRVLEAAGVTPADRVLFAFSFGPFLGFWTAFEAAARWGCLCIPGGGMRSSARLHTLMETGATVLCATPTYALHLAATAAEAGVRLESARVRRIVVAGEPGGSIPATRARIEELWPGARVVDHHGMTEIGPVTYGCPVRPGVLHVIESSFLAEVIDPHTGFPAAPESTGELVLTSLGRLGSPLLRYRTGDLVRPVPGPCACGSQEMALDGGILCRMDDMVVVRGVNVYPAAVEEILRSCGGVVEYRVRLSDRSELAELSVDVELEPGMPDRPAAAQRIEGALRDAFALRVPVSVVEPGVLPRFDIKASRWVRS